MDRTDDEPDLRYDERRQLNVTPDGRAVVELGGIGRTDTLTEVRAEQDDYDRPDDGDGTRLGTITKVRRESDDFIPELLYGTETRQAPGERDDFARGERLLGTETAVGAEQDDFAGTRGRRDTHPAASAWSGTKTSVRPESDDFDRSGDSDDTVAG